jgi:hypothetical protein
MKKGAKAKLRSSRASYLVFVAQKTLQDELFGQSLELTAVLALAHFAQGLRYALRVSRRAAVQKNSSVVVVVA